MMMMVSTGSFIFPLTPLCLGRRRLGSSNSRRASAFLGGRGSAISSLSRRKQGFMSLPSQCHRPKKNAKGPKSSTRCFDSKIQCQAGKVKLKLILDHQVKFGEHHALLGSAKFLGSWKDKKNMKWTESGWIVDLEANGGDRLEFKYIIVTHTGDIVWETGPNRIIDVPKVGSYEVLSHWNNTQEGADFIRRELEESENSIDSTAESADFEKETHNGSASSDRLVFSASSSFVQDWQGGEISFMRSNQHAKERVRKWDTTDLAGPALQVVKGDQNASNWWRKLELVQNLVKSDAWRGNRLEALLNAAIYLKWISTGQIRCYEDGGHHRPNRHAEISRLIFRELERLASDKDLSTVELTVIRKIHPCLPSFKSEFTASVPLTRIRDIAHRNDIPHDLKQEIKHTIQNKLHRNAGPEDLVATELLLARVTQNSGEYSSTFIEELKTFYTELKDFFNAGSLLEQLESIKPSLDSQNVSLVDGFLLQKKKLDEIDECTENASVMKELGSLIGTLNALATLRALFLKGLESGLRNDAPDDAIAMRQKWRLAEIGLEDYSFVLLSRFANVIDSAGGATWLTTAALSRSTDGWNFSLDAIVLGVRQLELSGWQKDECMAVQSEIKAWQSSGILEEEETKGGIKIWALRLKATLERARRISEAYSDTLLQFYPRNVEKLGNAFGIPETTIRTYTEAEIRSSIVFQVSKLCTFLLKSTRTVIGNGFWDPLVPGTAVGTLMEVDRIVPGSLPSSGNGPIILLVRGADGDEEIKAAGPNISGIILLQELPHLSHLGVRARQEKVVFATCEDDEQVANLRSMLSFPIKLDVNAEAVNISLYKEVNAGGELAKSGSRTHPFENEDGDESSKKILAPLQLGTALASLNKVVLSHPGSVLDLAEVGVEKAGAKAASCGQLASLARQSKKVNSDQGVSAAFQVPAGMAIPFGAMEAAIEISGSGRSFSALIDRIETAEVKASDLDQACIELQALVSAQKISPQVISELRKSLPEDARLIVRSSANVEDLAGMSAAGLYESIPNVKLSEPEAFTKAVAMVWASLFTRRAVLSRRVAGVSQKAASMAVLVQELLCPDLSFVLHTVSPVDCNKRVVEAEVAAGLGETLASGTRGTPWRIAGDKFDGSVKTLAFANFSDKLVVQAGDPDGKVSRRTVDYSKERLSTDTKYRYQLGQRLTTVGFYLEQHFGVPQDVEGCIIGNDIFIVQSRPQP